MNEMTHLWSMTLMYLLSVTLPGAPTDVSAVGVSPTSIEVSWSPPDSDGGMHTTYIHLFSAATH